MSLRDAPAWSASAWPSPVLMIAFVDREKIRPNPPVAMRIAFAQNPWIVPVMISRAVHPVQRPSAVTSDVTKNSSYTGTFSAVTCS